MAYDLPNSLNLLTGSGIYLLRNAPSAVRAGLKEKQLSIEYNIGKARLTLGCSKIKSGSRKRAMEWRMTIKMDSIYVTHDSDQ
jgi:hypothetical protein